MFALTGIGAVGVGIFTLDSPTGLPGSFALTAFSVLRPASHPGVPVDKPPRKAISIALGSVGLVNIMIMFVSDSGIIDLFGPIGHSGTERMIVYLAIIWLIAFGGYLMGSEGKGERSPA
jgi:hypothetical protein